MADQVASPVVTLEANTVKIDDVSNRSIKTMQDSQRALQALGSELKGQVGHAGLRQLPRGAAMLSQPVYFLTPDVVGFELSGRLREGCTATDLVLTITEQLRKEKVVGKFVEFYGEGVEALTLADRATIANMAPEYGATMGFFPVDQATIDYFEGTGCTTCIGNSGDLTPAIGFCLAGMSMRWVRGGDGLCSARFYRTRPWSASGAPGSVDQPGANCTSGPIHIAMPRYRLPWFGAQPVPACNRQPYDRSSNGCGQSRPLHKAEILEEDPRRWHP